MSNIAEEDELLKQRDTAAKQVEAIDIQLYEIEIEKRCKRNFALIGKKYKYHNSYSSPEDDGERWWNYYVVTNMNESGRLSALEFSTDIFNEYKIKQVYFDYSILMIEITDVEFNHELKEFKHTIEQLLNV